MGASLGALYSSVYMGVTYCCCNAMGSVCNACVGTTAEGTTGRKRSVVLLTMAILMAFSFQYQLGPAIVSQSGWIWKSYRAVPGMGMLVYRGWYNPCHDAYGTDPNDFGNEIDLMGDEHKTNDNGDDVTNAIEVCAGNSGVYRSMFLAALFFLIQGVTTLVLPSFQKEVWPAKYTLFGFSLLISVFIPTNPLFGQFFLWVARICSGIFVLFQQLILIDVAYNWNESWVENANQADRIVYGSGSNWLNAIVIACISLYGTVLTTIILLYQIFHGCPENIWIITLTLIGIIAMTAIQLVGREGSLLTSGVMSLYAIYLAFMMVSKNPNGVCNPRLGKSDFWGITVGLFVTTISLIWVGWSWTAEERLSSTQSLQQTNAVAATAPSTGVDLGNSSGADGPNLDVPFLDPSDRAPTGIVTADHGYNTEGNNDYWKLNVILAFVCCWVAMTLTGWGIIEEIETDISADNDIYVHAANPTVSRVNMAIIGISQWLSIGLYIWTLVAPKLFPDRDFS